MTESSQGSENTVADVGLGEGGKSIVSKNFSIIGDLTCEDILQIEGSVEGNITCQELHVSEGGRIKGDIRADSIDMHGTLTGAIDARVLTLSKTSNVVGDIVVHESLGIEPGANFDGSCKKLSSPENAGKDEPASSAAEPEVSAAPARAPEEMADIQDPMGEAPSPDASMADEGASRATAPEPAAMEAAVEADEPKAEENRIPGESMQSTLDRVAAELKATMNLAGANKQAAAPSGEPAKPAATMTSAPAAAPEKAPAPAAPAAPAAKATTAPAPEPTKPAAGANGAASSS